ncbi:MAG: carbohydrate porin [Polyangiales bacterium]
MRGTVSGFSSLAATVLGAAYSFNLTTWLTITPDLQYIIRPSGMKSIDNAFLAGVLLYLTF